MTIFENIRTLCRHKTISAWGQLCLIAFQRTIKEEKQLRIHLANLENKLAETPRKWTTKQRKAL